MSQLPTITLPTPVVVPAKSALNCTAAFVSQIIIQADPTRPWTTMYRWSPFDPVAMQTAGSMKQKFIPDLKALSAQRAAAGKPALSQALNSLLTALSELITEDAAPLAPPASPAPKAAPAKAPAASSKKASK